MVVRTLYVRERSLYSMRSLTLSQLRDLRMGVICEDLGALTTGRARLYCFMCKMNNANIINEKKSNIEQLESLRD